MKGKRIQDIVLIGAGNLATHLGLALVSHGFNVLQVCNRTPDKGRELALRVGAEFIAEPADLSPGADLYSLAVGDSPIGMVAKSLSLKNQLLVHTAGTIPMNILSAGSENYGVFYPLQTFSHERNIDFRTVPLCIEANSKISENQLLELAKSLSSKVQLLDGDQRKMLHLSAVFASNFTNFMQVIAADLLIENHLSFDLLKPLIRQTMQNVRQDHVFSHQTGPAFRGDHAVLEKHRELLAAHPGYLDIYNLISDNIIKYKTLHGKL